MSVEERVNYYLSNDDYHEATREMYRGMTNLSASNIQVAQEIFRQINEQISRERSLRDNPNLRESATASFSNLKSSIRRIAAQIDAEKNKTSVESKFKARRVDVDPETRRDFENINLERQLNRQNLKAIGWLKEGMSKAQAVCRVGVLEDATRPAYYYGTGVLLGSGWVLTSARNVSEEGELNPPTPHHLSKIVCQFGYDDYYLRPPSGEVIQYVVDPLDCIRPKDVSLDCVFLKLRPDTQGESKRKLTSWARINAGEDNPRPKDFVPIIQHPDGEAKQISVHSNEIVKVDDTHIWYTSDTERNSSGAPIFNEDWNFIGIHTSRGDPISSRSMLGRKVFPNVGLRVSKILKDENMQKGWLRIAW